MNLLTINSGSSSLKVAGYRLGKTETRTIVADVDRIGSAKSRIRVRDSNSHSLLDREEKIPDHGTALRFLLSWMGQQGLSSDIDGIGHRVVLGDRRFTQPQLITEPLFRSLQEHAEIAPDHVPQLIEIIETVVRVFLRKFIGAYTAALGGLDTLVFTGGIGEHAAVIRDRICRGLNCLGITLNAEANASDAAVISALNSSVTVRVIQTNEDLMIARHTRQVITNRDLDTVKQ